MEPFVLVTGATGQQGGATARALLAAGTAVHALVRTPNAPRATALAEAGATLVPGDLDDPASLRDALDGARGLFSVQTPDMADPLGDAELRHARHLAGAVREAGVDQVVHTSVSGADREPVDEDRWGPFVAHYWRTKADAERLIREAGARWWTILRPALFLENFLPPSHYFPDPERPDHLLVALDPDVDQPFVAVDDIGAAAAAAFTDPRRFDRADLELAGDRRTFRQIAAVLTEVRGSEVTLPESPQRARAEGLGPELALYQEYVSTHPYPARPETARAWGLSLSTVDRWVRTAR